MKQFLLFFLGALLSNSALCQAIVSGRVVDSETNEALPGAVVTFEDGAGTTTDLDGSYSLKLDNGTYLLRATYVGMEPMSIPVEVSGENQTVDFLMISGSTMSEVNVTADMAVGRRTPVAFSDISSLKIKEELASRDLPMILNTTPGVYATQSGGGDGDARVNIRGFNQRNVSVMVDGIPMNDMENGWVYWSNWFGLDNVTQKTQVQRGLGASKLAVPSIGGNINILTQGMEEKFNVKLSTELGNNNNMRQGFGINSGRLRGDWAVTAAFSYKTNDGWVEQLSSKQIF
jgi:hypothetical protein